MTRKNRKQKPDQTAEPETSPENEPGNENSENESGIDWDRLEYQAEAADEVLEGEILTAEADRREQEGERAGPKLDATEEDRIRREIFYGATRQLILVANWTRPKPLKSLDLDLYGNQARQATDQIHDILMNISWFEKTFGPIQKFMDKYGAIFALGITMTANVKAEIGEQQAAEAPPERKQDKAPDGPDPNGKDFA